MTNLNKIKSVAIAMAFLVGGAFTASAQVQVEEQHARLFKNTEDTNNHEILTLLKQEEEFSTFVELLEQSGLEQALDFAEPVTVLAPTNDAFKELSKADYLKLTDEDNRAYLNRVLQAHFLPNKVHFAEFQGNQILEGPGGEDITVESVGGVPGSPATVSVGGARIVRSDVEASNGIIHVINRVIIPGETGTRAHPHRR